MADVTAAEHRPDRKTLPSRWRWPLAALAGVVVIASVVGGRWWLTYEAAPQLVEGGWQSDDLDWIQIRTPQEFTRIFRCEPGALSLWIGFMAPPGRATTLESVRVPLFDGVWGDMGWATRRSTEMLPDLTGRGDLDVLVPFEPVRLEPERDWVRMRITYDIHECTRIDGLMTPTVEITYRAMGRTRTTPVEPLEPLRLTTQSLDTVERQVEVVRSGAEG